MTYAEESDRSWERWKALTYLVPSPIAGLIDASARPDPRERLWGQLTLAAGTVRFLAYLYAADAVARGAALSLSVVKQPGLGGWLDLFVKAVESGRALPSPSLLPRVGEVVRNGRVEGLTALVERRNDIAHLRVDPFRRESVGPIADELRPSLEALLALVEPLCGVPFGWFDQLTNGPDGFSVSWYPMRGPALRHRDTVRLRCRVPPPTGRVVVLDPEMQRALVLDPLILRHDPSIVLLDGAIDAEHVRYVSPVPGESIGSSYPDALPSPRLDGNVPLNAYLKAPREWHHLYALDLEAPSRAALLSSQAPTLHRIEAPPIASISPAPPSPPTPSWTSPPSSPSAYPAATVSTPPITLHAAPTRSSPRWFAAGALVVAGSVGVFALLARRGPQTRAMVPVLASQTSDSAVTHFLPAWIDAVSRGVGALDGFYLPEVAFHGMSRPQGIEFIRGRWWERRNAGRFEVRSPTSRWYVDDESSANTPALCRGVAGADPGVYVLRLDATEVGAPLGTAESARAQCARVDGPYLLRARRVGGSLRICHETWHRDEALCRSCPAAWACRPR